MHAKVMTVLRDDDIWIDRPDHPGTRLLVDVIRECVIEFQNAEYCKEIYRKVKKDLTVMISHGNSNSSNPPRIYTGPNERNLTVCEGPVLARTIGHLYDNERRSCSTSNNKMLPRRSNDNKFDYVERLNESGLISTRSIRSSRSRGSSGSHRSRSHRSKSRSRRGSRSRSRHSRSRSRSRHGDDDGHSGRSGRSRSRHGSRSRSGSGRSRSRSRSRSSHGSDRSLASTRSSSRERKSNRRRYGRRMSSRSLDSRTSRRSSRQQGVEYDSKDYYTDDKDRRRQYKKQGSHNNSTQSLQSLESSRSSKQQRYERGGSLRSLHSQRSQKTEQSESRQQLRDRSDRDRRSLRKVDRDDHSFESMNGKSDSTNSGSSKIRKRRKKKRRSVDASSLVYNKIDAQSHYDGTSLSMDKSSRTDNTAISSRSPIQAAALDVGDIESGINVDLYPDLNPDDLDVNFVYLDVEECPGTISLYDAMQKVGDKNGWPKYSRKICKSIIKKMGTEMRYFESLSSGNEITDANTLYSSFRPLYLKHQYMKKANIRDVYFDVPNHPGNSAFLRAVQQETIKGGVDQKFDWSVYIKIKKRLYDSKYFIGNPPSCFQIVADQDLYGRVKETYLHEIKHRKLILKWRSAKPVPGTVFCPALMKRLLACLNRILCSRMSRYCCKDSSRFQQNYLRLSSCWVRTTKCWRYDAVTRKTIWERINDDFTIKYREGCTTSWPLLILSGTMLFVVVALFVQLFTKSILFKFI